MDIISLNETYNTAYTNKLVAHKHIFDELYNECGTTFMRGCGSYLFDGQTYTYCDIMYKKQELLFTSAKKASRVLEIGTYMGHSLFIMLLANPTLKITCIDIDDRYTGPAVKVLNKYFNNAITFIHNDSLEALKSLSDTFDFFHIDGHHVNSYIDREFTLIQRLNESSDNILRVIFDDQDCMIPLQNDIEKQFTVLTKIIPKCKWNNVYYELKL